MGHTGGSTDLTYDRLRSLLEKKGYREHLSPDQRADRISFVHSMSGHIISLDRPAGREYLTAYQLRMVEEELQRSGSGTD